MEQNKFGVDGWGAVKNLQMIEEGGIKKVIINGRIYMSWEKGDELSQRLAVVQIYESRMFTQEEIADCFKIHLNSVCNYVQSFKAEGASGLINRKRGPKSSWKIGARLRSKILAIALLEGEVECRSIQKRLEQWNECIGIESIRQVLIDNGIIDDKTGKFSACALHADRSEWPKQNNFFDNQNIRQLNFGFDIDSEGEKVSESSDLNKIEEETVSGIEADDNINFSSEERPGQRYYSAAQRMYLSQLERGEYNTYAGGLLFLPLLARYSYFPTIKEIINLESYEGYTLEELCLSLFYFDIYEFRSMEDYKRAYLEEFGILIGRSSGPSLFTLRRFLHKIKKYRVSEKLINEFSYVYLKEGIARWGVLYIDGHFLPYWGIYSISMGWHGVRKIPMKGNYNFIGVDDKFNPWIFLIRSSKEDLLKKIPEMIEKAKELGQRAGISEAEIEKLIVIFDREGYSAELFRYFDGRDKDGEKRRAIFITWAKYTEKWVYNISAEKFDKEIKINYKIQPAKTVRYFETERVMKKYGKIRTVVVGKATDKWRCAIYTNAQESEIPSETLVQLICRRWGEENLIKELLEKHLINYWPGYESENLAEQPLVDNPKLQELKEKRANLKTALAQIKSKFGDEVLTEMEQGVKWDQIKEKHILTLADIEKIRLEMTLLAQEIDGLPEKIRFDEAHNGKKLVELNYERKRFLDCIKVFGYNMKNKLCEMLLTHYDKKKELLPAISKIINRAGYVKLEEGKLKVRLKGFNDSDIDYAARHLCEDLNNMRPMTLDKFRIPIHFEIL